MKHIKNKHLISSGCILIAVALCIALWGIMDEQRAAHSVQQALEAMEEQKAAQNLQDIQSMFDSVQEEMPVTVIDGIEYIGELEIPSLELEFLIISQWSEDSLKIAPCRYSGSVYSNDLIIAGHNYKSHFNGLRQLGEGDEIRLTDMADHSFSYQVTAIEKISGTAVEEMVEGEWDLTLFTCTPGGQNRLAVRCARLKEE